VAEYTIAHPNPKFPELAAGVNFLKTTPVGRIVSRVWLDDVTGTL